MRRPGRSPPQWATASAYLSEPLAGKAALGFVPDEIPPASWFNYIWNQTGAWLGFLVGPSTSAFSPRPFPTPNIGYTMTAADVDTVTVDDDEARYRYAVAAIDTTGPCLLVSRRGLEWVRRDNIPAAAGTLAGIYFSPVAGQWWLWSDTKVFSGPADTGSGTSPLRDVAFGWFTETLPASPGVVAGVVGHFTDLVATTSTKLLRRTGGVWAEIAGLTDRQAGRAIVRTGTTLVEISSTGGDGIVYTATDPTGAWTLRPTLTGVGVGTSWRLAVGDDGVVVAFKTAVDVPEMWLSDDHGATWATVITPATLKRLTALRWHAGVWVATSTTAPYAWTSGDLESWLALPVPVGEADAELRGVLYGTASWMLVARARVLQGAPAIDPGEEGYTPGTASSALGDAGWLRGYRISTTAPTSGQVLAWDGTEYTPATGARAATTGDVDTADATWTTIVTLAPGASSSVVLAGTVAAIRDDGTEGGAWTFVARARRPASGVPVMGTAIFTLVDHDGTGWDVRVQVSGSDVVVQVRGEAATTLTWRAEIQATEASI